MMKLFKGLEEGPQRCAEFWDLTGMFPIPKNEIKCRCCGEEALTARDYRFHEAPWSPNPYRCTLRFKCTVCSALQMFGVVIPYKMYKLHWDYIYNWREIKASLEAGKPIKAVVEGGILTNIEEN